MVVTLQKYKFTQLEKSEIGERQQKAIDYLLKNDRITNEEYRQINPKIGRHTALNDLKDLIKKGVIVAEGKGKYTYYVLV